jgi:acetyltransferase-like isoleucine patch superfamily enzyme
MFEFPDPAGRILLHATVGALVMHHWQDRLSRKLVHLLTALRTGQTRRRLRRQGASLGGDCVIAGRHRISLVPAARLRIGSRVFIGEGVTLDLGPEANLSIEDGVCLREDCVIRCHGTLVIGKGSFLGTGVVCECYGRITIGEQVLISPQVHLYDFDHGIEDCATPMMQQPCLTGAVTIGDGAWLGAKVTVTRNVHIGPGAVIGANAVVTRDIPERMIAVGIPARVTGSRTSASRERELPASGVLAPAPL